jgi:hypothetical protein
VSEVVPRHEPLANRQSTFAVWVGHPNAGTALIGYLRLNDLVRWVARTWGQPRRRLAVDGVPPRPRRGTA